MATKPSEQEFATAEAAAEAMREQGRDPEHLAKVLRYLLTRNQALEELLVHTDLLLRFGMAEQELSLVRKCVDKLRAMDKDHAAQLDKDSPSPW